MSKLIDYLDSICLISQEKLNDYICDNDIKTLNSLVMYMRELINQDYIISDYSPFVFVPNSDIAGTGGCEEISCRLGRAEKFAVFSALYADRVYIQLEFVTHEHHEFIDLDEIESNDNLYQGYKLSLLRDISLIIAYKELIKNNIVVITPTHQFICRNCFQKEIFGKKLIDIKSTKEEIFLKADVVLEGYFPKRNEVAVSLQNVDEFFPDHNIIWGITDEIVVEKLKKEKVGSVITRKELFEKRINAFVENEIVSSMYTTKYCNEQKAKLITNKVSDAMFLSQKKGNRITEVKEYTNMLPEYDLLIPQNMSLKDVIRLRAEEAESFNKYRIALNQAVVEQKKTTDVTDWEKIYDDIIYPELNNLDMKLKQIRNGRLNRFFGTMAIVGTTLVASAFGNMINPEMFSNIPAFGTSVGAAGANFILDKTSTKKSELQNNDYFFLWKLRNANNSKFKPYL